MKKTLIALAALGVVGAASAQVTITGEVAFGLQKDAAAGSATQITTNDADVNFAVSEDLGGGLSASAMVGYEGTYRSGNVTVNKNALGVSGGFGSLVFANGLAGSNRLGSAVNAERDISDAMGGYAAAHQVTYTLPAFGPIKVDLNWYEAGTLDGIPTKLWDDASNSRVRVNYADGPWTAFLEHRKNGKRTRYATSYDMGVAKVALAWGSDKQSELTASIPMGAVTIDLHNATATASALVAAGKTKVSATGVAVVYALSKRTAVNWSTVTIKDSATAANNGSNYRVELSHKF
jgi:hypothetical protein